MLKGHFVGAPPRPVIPGLVTLYEGPRSKLDVTFLVDTGADRTVLMPQDSQRLKINFADPALRRVKYTGASGVISAVEIKGGIDFTDENNVAYPWRVKFLAVEPNTDIENLPSILGWDVMRDWKLTFDPRHGVVTAEINKVVP